MGVSAVDLGFVGEREREKYSVREELSHGKKNIRGRRGRGAVDVETRGGYPPKLVASRFVKCLSDEAKCCNG